MDTECEQEPHECEEVTEQVPVPSSGTAAACELGGKPSEVTC
jgi:hypothetical protein